MNEKNNESVVFTGPLLKKLKEEYQKALLEKRDTFVFEGREVVVSYARYLIQFLESVLKKD